MQQQVLDQADFRRWVDAQRGTAEKRCELLNGHIVREPPASWIHGILEARLNGILDRHVQHRRLGLVIGSSAGYELPTGDTVEPDLTFIAADRWAAGPKPNPHEFFRIVPNLVVEIQSPSSVRRDRVEKRRIYENNGVDEYWIIDAESRSIDIFVLRAGRYSRPRRHRASVRSAVLPDLVVELDVLFELPS